MPGRVRENHMLALNFACNEEEEVIPSILHPLSSDKLKFGGVPILNGVRERRTHYRKTDENAKREKKKGPGRKCGRKGGCVGLK